MSRSGWQGVEVFDRKPVAEAIRPLLESKDPKILQAAIEAAGSHNPFMQSQNAPFWLATVGPGHSVGLGTWDRNFDNVAGRVLWRDLVALIDSPVSENLRAAAVRSLGRSSVPELTAALQRWAVDSQPLVRQAAIVLFADVPGESAHQHIASAAADSSPQVRQAAAQAIGFGQIVSLVPLLGDLLKDDAPEVRDAAAMSLLSFPISASGDLLKTNINDPEYRSLFVNALAANQPEPYLADLEDIIAKHQAPSRFWGGIFPRTDWNPP